MAIATVISPQQATPSTRKRFEDHDGWNNSQPRSATRRSRGKVSTNVKNLVIFVTFFFTLYTGAFMLLQAKAIDKESVVKDIMDPASMRNNIRHRKKIDDDDDDDYYNSYITQNIHLINDNNDNSITIPNSSSCADITVPVKDDEWGARKFELLFRREEIPGIREQKVEFGRIIKSLIAFDGLLHYGYGDETDNTGPIAMFAYDPLAVDKDSSWVYLGTINSEEVRFFRRDPWGGVLYTPEIDGHGENRHDFAHIYHLTCGKKGYWTTLGNPIHGTAHNYDLAVFPQQQPGHSRLLVGTGARTNMPAFLMTSTNQGKTWRELVRVDSLKDTFWRIYNIGAFNINNSTAIFLSGRNKKKRVSFARIYYEEAGSFQPFTNLKITLRKDSDRRPYLVPLLLNDDLYLVAHTSPFHSPEPNEDFHIGTYRIEGTKLIKENPWPTIFDGEEAELVCWTIDDHSSINKLLVLMKDKKHDVAGVFRLIDSIPSPSSNHNSSMAWKLAVLLDRPGTDDGYSAMTLFRNDLYLGTLQGNLYIVREFYKPAIE
jgi:hypothetical protein